MSVDQDRPPLGGEWDGGFPLPGRYGAGSTAATAREPAGGVRRLRRVTTGLIAAMLVGVGAASAELGQLAHRQASVVAGSGSPAGTGTPAGSTSGRPAVSTPVVTSGGSIVAAGGAAGGGPGGTSSSSVRAGTPVVVSGGS